MPRLALWLPVLLALAGCGLADPPELSPRVDPGKGPFREAGAVEVCLQQARLNGDDEITSPLGLCVAAGDTVRACEGDAGCGVGERCVCGRCALEACRDERPCDGARICRAGLCVTPCKNDSACAQGEVCRSGGCSRPCGSGSACGYGGRCDLLAGVCGADVCAPDGTCAAGRTCAQIEQPMALREPAWLPDGASVLIEAREPGPARRASVYRAAVETPTRWRLDPSPLLPSGQDARAPAPLVSSGRIELLYTATADGRIVRRTLDDALSPGPAAEALAASEPWEQGRVGSPSAVEFRGRRLLFYQVGERAGLGLAELDTSGAVVSKRPLLAPSDVERPGRWQQVSALGSPDAVVSGDLLLVYFTARGVEGEAARQGSTELPADSNDSLGMLASDDGQRFDAAPGPVMARRSNLRTYLGEGESAMRLEPGGARLIFVAADAAGAAVGLGLALSP